MRKTIIATALIITVVFAKAQTGIQFEKSLSWQQVLDKAKAEHKYIFLDCYATWCGPCKEMDHEVYNRPDVGDVYNKDFISVRLQMDQTKSDNDSVKSWYATAKSIKSQYTVNAYPTLLFFDPNGLPVHCIRGSLDAAGFLRAATQAQNPDKQYYRILKNFKPGTLDTAEEKGLAQSFLRTNPELAGKLAADYLSRIAKAKLSELSNAQLMENCQDNPQVLEIAVVYIKSLSERNFAKTVNLNFIQSFSNQPKVAALVVNYFHGLNAQAQNQPDNLNLIEAFGGDSRVRTFALHFIDQLSEKEMLNAATLDFVKIFTSSPDQRGYAFFSENIDRIDRIINYPNYAESNLQEWISRAEWKPVFDTAKKLNVIPDFEKLKADISRKYKTEYTERVAAKAKVDWFSYQVKEKKRSQNWPQLVDAWVGYEKTTENESLSDPELFAFSNNDCWYIYLHIEDSVTLQKASVLMAKLTSDFKGDSNDLPGYLDTYACVLYKDGQTAKAIEVENRVVQLIDPVKHPVVSKPFIAKAEAMKRDEKIWLEKEFQ